MISSIAKLLQDLQAKEEAKFAPEPITHAPATSPKGETPTHRPALSARRRYIGSGSLLSGVFPAGSEDQEFPTT
jgi:hypothetical protein